MSPVAARANVVRSLCRAAVAWIPLLAIACGAPTADPEQVAESAQPVHPVPAIDTRKSLAVTDLPTLGATDAQGRLRFSLERVLGRLAKTSGADVDAIGLYTRLFDTNNAKADSFVADGQHCDDVKDAQGNPIINGFPIECPRQEGRLADIAHHNPFCEGPGCDPYTPVAMTNRFDLADPGGQNCGQHRIVFAKGVEQSPLTTAGNPRGFNRVLIIFEAMIPNPHPQQGLRGCGKLMETWAKLSTIKEPADRAAVLEKIFFSGVPGFEPAVTFDHYNGVLDPNTHVQMGGQIRINQFANEIGGQMWQLREYHTARSCTGNGAHRVCKARIKMDPTLVNPPGALFDENNTSPAAVAFRDPNTEGGFLSQVATLAATDVNRINMDALSRVYNNGQSTSSPTFGGPPVNDTNYAVSFNMTGPFAAAIQAELDKIGSPLKPLHIIRRAQTQACAGCHELSTSTAAFFGGSLEGNKLGSGLVWPDTALGPDLDPGPDVVRINAFTQISDAVLEPLVPGVMCDTTCTAHPQSCPCAWAVSPAMANVFLPFRREHLQQYLASLP